MNIQVAQVCNGRFHHFDLARQLAKRDMLARFFTGYPGWKLRGEAIPADRVKSFPWVMTPYMALAGWGVLGQPWERSLSWLAKESLDAYVARRLPECDVLLVLSGAGLRSARVARKRGIRFVCDRGSAHIRYQDTLLREEFARWDQRFPGIDPRVIEKEEGEYDLADMITVPSEFALRSFIEMGIEPAKLRKVPYGVDVRRFGKSAAPDRGRFDVLFVGQVSFQKGVPYLLRAFSRLRHSCKRLRIVGSLGPEMRRYFDRHPPSPDVELLGHMPQTRLKDVMSRAHVMVLPSVQDGFGMVLSQALACGCPVIGTWNTGAADLFSDGVEGFIVPPRDPEAIAERLQQLADDPDRRDGMSEAALRRVDELGGWDAYGERMASVLTEMVEGPRMASEPARATDG